VEALKLRRKVVGVDVNPIAAYVTSNECAPADLAEFRSLFTQLTDRVENELSSLYRTHCNKCRSEAVADWLEWDEKTKHILRIKCECPTELGYWWIWNGAQIRNHRRCPRIWGKGDGYIHAWRS